ncbi:hypothetical protein MCERE19_02076 [Spirosomataceae bacterium]
MKIEPFGVILHSVLTMGATGFDGMTPLRV